jgi:uncharacterized protein YlxW (UPF0749 family)
MSERGIITDDNGSPEVIDFDPIVGPNYAQGNLKMAGVQLLEMFVIIACTLLLGGLTALVVWLIIRASKNKANRSGSTSNSSELTYLRQEVARLNKEVERLREDVEQLKNGPKATGSTDIRSK